VPRAQAATSSAFVPTKIVRTAGSAAPVAPAQAVASGTGRTAATRPVSITPITNAHSMRTRGKASIAQPMDRLNLPVVPMSPLPRSIHDVLSYPNWCSAMQAEYDALLTNDTWSLVPRPPGVNLVTGKWIYRHKLLADGLLDRYKARWVLWGFTQRPGVMTRLLVQWSSQRKFRWFYLWCYLRTGLSISWMLRMRSYMAL